MILIPRRLQPRILLVHIQVLEGRLRPRVPRLGLALVWMFSTLVSVAVLIPRVCDVLGYVRRIYRMYLRQIATKDRSALQVKSCRIFHAALWVISIVKEIAQAFAVPKPLAVKTGNRQNIGHLD